MQKKQGLKAPRQIRIIGGQWKRTILPVLDAEGLRPTPDRVRETVFNWLNYLLDASWETAACLDLFAGTGALGFEAASRGAGRVVMVEQNLSASMHLEATKARLNAARVSILRGDALAAAQRMIADAPAARFNVIFVDPPYHRDWLPKILPLCEKLLTEGGLVYAESEAPLDAEPRPEWMAAWNLVRAGKAGMVFYHLLQCKTGPGFKA
jgi:16S rRNA (guanine966-N2)-methyltransferase